MPQALEITYFHNILEQNVLGNMKLLNEQKSRMSNWIKRFPYPLSQRLEKSRCNLQP